MTTTITRSSPELAHYVAEARRRRAEVLAGLVRGAVLSGVRRVRAAATLDGQPCGPRVSPAARRSR